MEISQAIASLKKDGVTPEQMQTLLDALSIELVLTAHPTLAPVVEGRIVGP